MELTNEQFDRRGERIGDRYSLLMTDPNFEQRLKLFDPRLKLTFDQKERRWVILEWAYDNSGWNVIIKAEDRLGNPRPLGEWVFGLLWAYRKAYEEKKRMGIDNWFKKLKAESDSQKKEERDKISDENQALLRDDVIAWRKGAKELANLPASDVVAGYRKI